MREPIKHVFIWPAFLVVLLVGIFPLIYSLTISFQSMRLVPPMPPRFVGLDNYASLLANPRFWATVQTTSIIVFVSVSISMSSALLSRSRCIARFRASVCSASASCCRC